MRHLHVLHRTEVRQLRHRDRHDANDNQEAADTRREAGADHVARPAVQHVGDPRPAGDHDDEHTLQASSDGIVGRGQQHRLTERGGGHVGSPKIGRAHV